MTDYISRQDAIEAIEQAMINHDSAIMRVIDLPSAQRTGEWIEDGYSHYKAVCDQCGEPCATYVMNKPRDRFCKWCGADMRGENNETD